MEPKRPQPRGPLSRWVLAHEPTRAAAAPVPRRGTGFDDDLQLALYLCYEGHYSDVPGVAWDEWDPAVIAFRRTLEQEFERSLREVAAVPDAPDAPDEPGAGGASAAAVRELIPAMIEADRSPSLSRYMESSGTLPQMREFVVHRSAYQLKEADPHTYAIPHVHGRAKQLLAAIQAGEYGADAPDRLMHADLFARTMRALGLDHRRHAHLDQLPASALMVSNLISMFGLNRRWRGALVGHLAVFEMTSVAPMGRYSRGLERMGAPVEARRFYDVHVLADAEHEVMALQMAAALAEDEPHLVRDVLFGAACVIEVERMFAQQLLTSWGVRSATAVPPAGATAPVVTVPVVAAASAA